MSMLARLGCMLLVMGGLAPSFAIAQRAVGTTKEFFRTGSASLAKAGPADRAPGVVSQAVPVEFNAGEMLNLVPGDEISLALPRSKSRAVVFERSHAHGGNIHSWVGYFKERGNSNRVLVTTGPAGSFGVIESPEGTYRIVPGKNHDWLVDMAAEALHVPPMSAENDELMAPTPPDGLQPLVGEPTFEAAPFRLGGPRIAKVTPAPQAVIDLMVVVTRTLANRLGAALMTRLNFLVTRANIAYIDSEIAITLRLVNVTVVDYTDASSNVTAINAISADPSLDVATFGSIEAIRTQVRADMVSLMRDGGAFGGSGLAWVNGVNGIFQPNHMYSVITGCVMACDDVFIHELGHNMGNLHDRATEAWQHAGGTSYASPLRGAYGYSYGYAFCKSGILSCNPALANDTPGACPAGTEPQCATSDASNFMDLMAYFHSSTRIFKFSSPLLPCATPLGDGIARPCGVSQAAIGTGLPDGSSDTVSTMNNTRLAISGLKTGVANPPGLFYFTQSSFSRAESGGTMTFSVARGNGSGGAVSVSYTVTGASATAGTDFTVASGTLAWADGETGNKTFAVPIINDAIVEGIESFTAWLSNATGSATIAFPSSAAGLILEAWPPAGVAPAGFVSSSTPTNATTPAGLWGAAVDSFDAVPGDGSSFKSGAFAGNATGSSSTQFTGTFATGNVYFSYRVSSFPNSGFFDFLVDGVVVFSDSGDTGLWQSHTAAITAGTHTLEWRYRKGLPFPCANLLPITTPPTTIPPYPNCQDRVWIDTVSLPLATAASNPPRVSGISTRMQVLTGDEVLIGGFIIGGSTPKMVVINARGPSLTGQGVAGALANPTLTLVPAAGGPAITNDDWMSAPNAAMIQTLGLAPPNARESSILATLDPGAYTAIVSGVGGATGVGIVEVFEVDNPDIPLTGISTRGRVQTADGVMIGGFIIQGDSPQAVVVRARGPSLTAQGVAGALANPTLTLVPASGAPAITNDDWGTAANAAALLASGFAPADPRESAILVTLAPGAYTAIVTGVGGTTGVAIVEVYKQ